MISYSILQGRRTLGRTAQAVCRGGFLLGCFALLALEANASVIYVNASQTNVPPDGVSWATAFPTVQQGIDAGAEGDAVWVAASVYVQNITVKNGVALYGGFAGTESQLSQRDFLRNLTIQDGGQSNTVVNFTGGATNTTRLDGFVIRNGKATSGAGILLSNASPIIVNNVIMQNNGGAIRCAWGSSPLIAFNWIRQNAAGSSSICAGIECLSAAPKIQNNRIVGNSVSANGSGAGGISCFGTPSPEIDNNLILGNVSPNYSGVWIAGGILVFSSSAPKIVNNTIAWNGTTTLAAGINCESTQAIIANNIIAFGSFGVVGVSGMTFENNCVFGNTSGNFTGFTDPTGSNGNISVDPLLAASSPYPDVHLTSTSPCRDAGNTALVQVGWVDLDGGARVVGAAVDIGAIEFSGATPAFIPAVVRVSPSGNDQKDGSSWANAKRTVQAAIDGATITGGEVWAQAGTYNECLMLRPLVYLYGGFAGNETNRNQRDWKANPTILDGGQRGASVITANNLLQWNGVDGFTIQNGKARNGGGIYCQYSSPVIANNTITGNLATDINTFQSAFGGGIWLFGSSPLISNNVVTLNQASQGGGIYSGNSSFPIIANNRFESNVAAIAAIIGGYPPNGGGGIYLDGASSPQIVNNFFLANIATNQPGVFGDSSGGAIACNYPASPQIIGNTFLGNLAVSTTHFDADNGGGICAYSTTAIMVNNLLAFGSSGIFALSTTNGYGNRIRNNCVYGNVTNYVFADPTGTNGNISADPLLAAPNDFHLTAGSPCINAGDNSVVTPGSLDLDGQVRIAGGQVDIGADEYGSAIPFALSLTTEGGQSVLSLIAETNRTYVFEVSGDLLNWIAFSTNVATNITMTIPEPARTASQAFYRVRVLP